MDDLFGKNSDSSVFSPELKKNESENEDLESKIHSKVNAVDELLNSESPNLTKKSTSPSLKSISKTIEKKAEKCKKEKSVTNKLTKNQSEQIKSVKSTKNKNDVCVRNNTVVNEKKDSLNDQKKKSKIISSKSDGSSFKAKQISSKILPEKKKETETVDVKKYNFKCQKKIPVTNNKPINEHKVSFTFFKMNNNETFMIIFLNDFVIFFFFCYFVSFSFSQLYFLFLFYFISLLDLKNT